MRELTENELKAVSGGRRRQSNSATQVAVVVAVNAKASVKQTIVQRNGVTIIST
jgi:bacteriocin-like protein